MDNKSEVRMFMVCASFFGVTSLTFVGFLVVEAFDGAVVVGAWA
jgi:hypothetical protein